MNNSTLDIIAIISFLIGLENLEENRKQSAKQEKIINEIEKHLTKQDEQYTKIIELLERND